MPIDLESIEYCAKINVGFLSRAEIYFDILIDIAMVSRAAGAKYNEKRLILADLGINFLLYIAGLREEAFDQGW